MREQAGSGGEEERFMALSRRFPVLCSKTRTAGAPLIVRRHGIENQGRISSSRSARMSLEEALFAGGGARGALRLDGRHACFRDQGGARTSGPRLGGGSRRRVPDEPWRRRAWRSRRYQVTHASMAVRVMVRRTAEDFAPDTSTARTKITLRPGARFAKKRQVARPAALR